MPAAVPPEPSHATLARRGSSASAQVSRRPPRSSHVRAGLAGQEPASCAFASPRPASRPASWLSTAAYRLPLGAGMCGEPQDSTRMFHRGRMEGRAWALLSPAAVSFLTPSSDPMSCPFASGVTTSSSVEGHITVSRVEDRACRTAKCTSSALVEPPADRPAPSWTAAGRSATGAGKPHLRREGRPVCMTSLWWALVPPAAMPRES